MAASTVTIPGWIAGIWKLDPVHSEVSFSVRHMMISKVKGRFTGVTATVTTAEDPLQSTVQAEIDMSSVTTGNDQRDKDIRAREYFDVETHPKMTFTSSAVRVDGDRFSLDGNLSVHGVSRPVTLALELGGIGQDPWGGTRAGFTASGRLNRHDFGMSFDMPMDGGGMVVGDQINIMIEAEVVLDK